MSLHKVFIALDQMNIEEIETLLYNSEGKIKNVKIGLELFLKYGHSVILEIHNKFKVNIFLDLKLHDIPITVAKSIKSLEGLPINFLTLHLSGGREMLLEAIKARNEFVPNAKLLGVSVLTSLDSQNFNEIFGINLDSPVFDRLFRMASNVGLDGVVCSPNEASQVKAINAQVITMTPGVRFQSEIDSNLNIGDQKRATSIEWALKNNCDLIVMGRSITKAKNKEELIKILNFINSL